MIRMTTNGEKDHLRELYEGWLVTNGMAITRPNNPGVYTETVYNHPSGAGISIVQLNDGSDKIIITTRVNFGPDIQQAIGAMDASAQRSFSNGMAIAIMQLGAQFNFHAQNNTIQSVNIERTVFGEGLTKQVFFDNLFTVISAAVVVVMRLQDRFGVQQGRAPASGIASSPGIR